MISQKKGGKISDMKVCNKDANTNIFDITEFILCPQDSGNLGTSCLKEVNLNDVKQKVYSLGGDT